MSGGGERAEADVCIVGAGYAGLAAARELYKAGLSVIAWGDAARSGHRAAAEILNRT